jgi:2-[(L-alanin-3-ylcarbamoyl)methyl]-2-hydroxybutanedioate decarboxylase
VIPPELERCDRATLVFDLATIDVTMTRVANAARAAGITPLFAAKSFPHPRVYELAAQRLDGFDVASPAELDAVPRARVISIADPTGAAIAQAHTRVEQGARVIVSCETEAQVDAAPPGTEIAIRVSASITGRDPAVGAILEGNGRRRSRFGLEDREHVDALAIRAAQRGHRVGLHVHHGPVLATSSERFVSTALAALELVDVLPAFLDLGGAWNGLPDLASAFAQVRTAVPRLVDLIVEPGRLFAAGAGFAAGRVMSARTLRDRELRVVDLSRTCHLRWSPVELVAPAPRPGHGRNVLVVGPTCYEEDTIGEWTIEPSHVAERVIVRDVPGYAVAWNTGFGGVAPANVLVR